MDGVAQSVLDFWFGATDHGFPRDDRGALWWGAQTEHDDAVRERFGDLLTMCETGGCEGWRRHPSARLAGILVCDQFTRMIHRGSADAFRNDTAALDWAEEGIERQHDRALPPGYRVFFYMPFMHAEGLAAQDRCIALFESLLQDTPAPHRATIENNLRFARDHRDVIARFGRFPHRNLLLGRTPTPEEVTYLAEGGAHWGQ